MLQWFTFLKDIQHVRMYTWLGVWRLVIWLKEEVFTLSTAGPCSSLSLGCRPAHCFPTACQVGWQLDVDPKREGLLYMHMISTTAGARVQKTDGPLSRYLWSELSLPARSYDSLPLTREDSWLQVVINIRQFWLPVRPASDSANWTNYSTVCECCKVLRKRATEIVSNF
jgi:hypothetical protein